MSDPIRFEFGAADSHGKRLVKAFHGVELLAQERLDVLQSWQAKPFLEKIAGALPYTAGFDGFDNAVAYVGGQFEKAVRNMSADSKTEQSAQPILQPMADIVTREIAWLWPNRFALGKLSLIIGDPGNGKSFWSVDVAARISTATRWPDDCGCAPLGSVILMGVEDDLEDTVKPRLEAAGADVSKIVALTGVANEDEAGQYERTVDLRRDIPILEIALQRVTETRAIIIDPISAFMGKTDSHVNAEVRETLAPLAKLAERHGVAIIAITHLRKGETAALHRAMGSVAFTAAARSVWAIAKDKRDPDGRRRLLLPVKSNISEDQGGLAFTLTKQHGLPNAMPHIEYQPEQVTTSADDALSNEPRKRGPEPEAQEEAEQFLRDALADGPQPTKQIELEAREGYGITMATLKRARKALEVESFRDVIPGPWLLRLPKEINKTNNLTAYKQPEPLEPLGETSGKSNETTPQESKALTLSVYERVGTNGHDDGEANRLFSEAGEAVGDPRVDKMLDDFLKGF